MSHWSSGARRLFGPGKEDAVGRPAADLLPVSGALERQYDTTATAMRSSRSSVPGSTGR